MSEIFKIKIILLAIIFFGGLAIAFPAYGATYYADAVNGNDSNTGLTENLAWKTIAKANSTVAAGDTCYFRAGNYSDPITPAVTGTAVNPITYKAYIGEVPILVGTNSGVKLGTAVLDHAYIVVDGFAIAGPTYVSVIIDYGANHNTIQNCIMTANQDYFGWAMVVITYMANYNTIKNNIITGVMPCNPAHPQAAADLIYIREATHHNLIEGNTLSYATHVGIEIQDATCHHNIIRRNTITNPYHTGVNIYTSSYGNIVEENIIYDCGSVCNDTDCAANLCGSTSDKSHARYLHPSLVVGAPYNIIRKNILEGSGGGLFLEEYAGRDGSHNRIYNNVMANNIRGMNVWGDRSQTDNYFQNNIIYNNRDYGIYEDVYGDDHLNYYFYNDLVGGAISLVRTRGAGIQSLVWHEANLSSEWSNNITAAPVFNGVTPRDYSLVTGSVLIDAGGNLTQANGTGSNSDKLIVEDARWFTDGLGIIKGDQIKIVGDSVPRNVTAINYDTNTITISPAATWGDNVGVSLVFDGAAPDIGAYEFQPGNDTISPDIPTGLNAR